MKEGEDLLYLFDIYEIKLNRLQGIDAHKLNVNIAEKVNGKKEVSLITRNFPLRDG